jgi:hypothetical protein
MEPSEISEYNRRYPAGPDFSLNTSPDHRERKTVQINGKAHWILNAGSGNKGIDYGNRTHLSKLIIRRATVADSGTYVCLAANSMGYNYREARLVVKDPGKAIYNIYFQMIYV